MTKDELVSWMAKEAGITKKGSRCGSQCVRESHSRFIEEKDR